MMRDNKPEGFFYLDHRTVDSKNNIIMDVHVTPGNVSDSDPILKRIDRIKETFNIKNTKNLNTIIENLNSLDLIK